MPTETTAPPAKRALVVIPGTVNYFYNLSGHRVAEALRSLGLDVDVRTLAEVPDGAEYDWCLLSSVPEILHGAGDEAKGLASLRALRGRCRATASCGLDSVATPWYAKLRDLTARAGVETILDLGLHDQSGGLDTAGRRIYRFVFSGLTPSERAMLDAPLDDERRTIPWSFVGHSTALRVALVDHLVQSVDPRGFIYIPSLSVYAEKGSPHLNREQFEAVLARTRYQIWCSHHGHFYMEPERFRASLLTGGVPVKIVASRSAVPKSAPLGYLMMEPNDVGDRLTPAVFDRVRRRFREDWLGFPTLAEGIARVLEEAGISASPSVSGGEGATVVPEKAHRFPRAPHLGRLVGRLSPLKPR